MKLMQTVDSKKKSMKKAISCLFCGFENSLVCNRVVEVSIGILYKRPSQKQTYSFFFC